MNDIYDPGAGAKRAKEEAKRLHFWGRTLTTLAWLSLWVGVGCVVAAGYELGMDGWVLGDSIGKAQVFWLWLGGSLASTAIVFFFFAQLAHIRAALEK